MEHLTIKELMAYVKANWDGQRHCRDIDDFLLQRKPLELLLMAHELSCQQKRAVKASATSSLFDRGDNLHLDPDYQAERQSMIEQDREDELDERDSVPTDPREAESLLSY